MDLRRGSHGIACLRPNRLRRPHRPHRLGPRSYTRSQLESWVDSSQKLSSRPLILIRSTTKSPKVRMFVFSESEALGIIGATVYIRSICGLARPDFARNEAGTSGRGVPYSRHAPSTLIRFVSRVDGYHQTHILSGRLGATQRLDHTTVGSGGGGRSRKDAGSRKDQSRG